MDASVLPVTPFASPWRLSRLFYLVNVSVAMASLLGFELWHQASRSFGVATSTGSSP